MPGFNVGNSGGAPNTPSNTIETRRKHRWVFRYLGKGQKQWNTAALLLLKTTTRPNQKFEPVEMHHDQEVAYFAGKQSWETCKLEWYDGEQDPDVSGELYEWLETVSNLATANVNVPSYYKSNAELAMTNGQGIDTQRWTMYGSWPQSADFSELDYQATEIATVKAELRYDRATKACFNSTTPGYLAPSCPV